MQPQRTRLAYCGFARQAGEVDAARTHPPQVGFVRHAMPSEMHVRAVHDWHALEGGVGPASGAPASTGGGGTPAHSRVHSLGHAPHAHDRTRWKAALVAQAGAP